MDCDQQLSLAILAIRYLFVIVTIIFRGDVWAGCFYLNSAEY